MKTVHFDALGDSLINGKRPEFDNPNDWTQEDMTRWFAKHNDHYRMAWNLRCMALSYHMKTYTPDNDPLLSENPPSALVKRDTEERVEYVVWCDYGNDEEVTYWSDLARAQEYWWKLVNETDSEVKLKRVTTETVLRTHRHSDN